jgi:hypothetical protein
MQVIDTGVGIPQSFHPSIFSSFTQATEDRTRRHGGLGLGLAICSHLAHLMGASLTIARNEGAAGTTAVLSMQLPISGQLASRLPVGELPAHTEPSGVPFFCNHLPTCTARADCHAHLQPALRSEDARLQHCIAIAHVSNAAVLRQLRSSAQAIGMQLREAPGLAYDGDADAIAPSCAGGPGLTPVLICEASTVAQALQEGWKRHAVVALCVEKMVPHALRMFAVSLMLPIKHRQLCSALVCAATGQTTHESSLEVPLGKPQAEPSQPHACTAGFGGEACGFCVKCQEAREEGVAMAVCPCNLRADVTVQMLQVLPLHPML